MRKKIVYGIPSARIDEIQWRLDFILNENGHGTVIRDISFEQDTCGDGTILSANLDHRGDTMIEYAIGDGHTYFRALTLTDAINAAATDKNKWRIYERTVTNWTEVE